MTTGSATIAEAMVRPASGALVILRTARAGRVGADAGPVFVRLDPSRPPTRQCFEWISLRGSARRSRWGRKTMC